MHALILSDDPKIHHSLTQALVTRGFQLVHSESVMMATAHVRMWSFDLIIMSEHVQGQLTHRVALSAEKRAPHVKTLLMTERVGEEVEELFDLLPSLVSLIAPDVSPELTGQIAAACVTGSARSLGRPKGLGDPPPFFSSLRGARAPDALAS